jgi:putative chitinase
MTILALTETLTKLKIDPSWAEPLAEVFHRYEINTPARQAAFIGQCAHESMNFTKLEENLSYSAEGLMKTWPSRFPTLEVAKPYHRNPEKIANKVYGGRMGNGTEETGDGWLYHGRGLIQLTGKDNYTLAGDALNMDFIHSPDYVLVPKYAALTAGWYWNKRQLNKEADAKDYTGMTKKINGGTIGLDDRIAHIKHAQEVLTA